MDSMDGSCTVGVDRLLALKLAMRCPNTNSMLALKCCFTSELRASPMPLRYHPHQYTTTSAFINVMLPPGVTTATI